MRKRVVLHVFFLRFVATALVGFPLLFFAHPLWSAETKPPQKATYIGTEVCKACHAPQVAYGQIGLRLRENEQGPRG